MKIIIIVICSLFVINATAQQQKFHSKADEEEMLKAKTKQIGQFIRRFNHEENARGKRLHEGNRKYRDEKLRKKFIEHLFDKQSSTISSEMCNNFIEDVTKIQNPQFLDFHKENWYAEVSTNFKHFGNDVKLLLYLKIEKENDGYKWVLTNVHYENFNDLFSPKPKGIAPFLHPMSHELDFMNIRKIFEDVKQIEFFAEKNYKPDYLTLFFYEIKKSNLKFESVNKVKFHFLQIDNWYFQLEEFNRYDHNSGWLISNLLKMTENEKKQFINLIHPE